MENSNISVGLDIGTTKIVALVGKKNEFNKVEILGVGKSKSLGVHRGVVKQYYPNHPIYSASSRGRQTEFWS
jgi:cell division ATPase FtsA